MDPGRYVLAALIFSIAAVIRDLEAGETTTLPSSVAGFASGKLPTSGISPSGLPPPPPPIELDPDLFVKLNACSTIQVVQVPLKILQPFSIDLTDPSATTFQTLKTKIETATSNAFKTAGGYLVSGVFLGNFTDGSSSIMANFTVVAGTNGTLPAIGGAASVLNSLIASGRFGELPVDSKSIAISFPIPDFSEWAPFLPDLRPQLSPEIMKALQNFAQALYMDVQMKILTPYTSDLANLASAPAVQLKQQIFDTVTGIYRGTEFKVVDVIINKFTPGSVVADYTTVLGANDTTTDPSSVFSNATGNGTFGTLTIDPTQTNVTSEEVPMLNLTSPMPTTSAMTLTGSTTRIPTGGSTPMSTPTLVSGVSTSSLASAPATSTTGTPPRVTTLAAGQTAAGSTTGASAGSTTATVAPKNGAATGGSTVSGTTAAGTTGATSGATGGSSTTGASPAGATSTPNTGSSTTASTGGTATTRTTTGATGATSSGVTGTGTSSKVTSAVGVTGTGTTGVSGSTVSGSTASGTGASGSVTATTAARSSGNVTASTTAATTTTTTTTKTTVKTTLKPNGTTTTTPKPTYPPLTRDAVTQCQNLDNSLLGSCLFDIVARMLPANETVVALLHSSAYHYLTQTTDPDQNAARVYITSLDVKWANEALASTFAALTAQRVRAAMKNAYLSQASDLGTGVGDEVADLATGYMESGDMTFDRDAAGKMLLMFEQQLGARTMNIALRNMPPLYSKVITLNMQLLYVDEYKNLSSPQSIALKMAVADEFEKKIELNNGIQYAFVVNSLTKGSVDVNAQVTYDYVNPNGTDPILAVEKALTADPTLGNMTINPSRSNFGTEISFLDKLMSNKGQDSKLILSTTIPAFIGIFIFVLIVLCCTSTAGKPTAAKKESVA